MVLVGRQSSTEHPIYYLYHQQLTTTDDILDYTKLLANRVSWMMLRKSIYQTEPSITHDPYAEGNLVLHLGHLRFQLSLSKAMDMVSLSPGAIEQGHDCGEMILRVLWFKTKNRPFSTNSNPGLFVNMTISNFRSPYIDGELR